MIHSSLLQFGHAYLLALLVKATATSESFDLPPALDWDHLTATLAELWQLSQHLSPPLLAQLNLSVLSFNKV